MEVSAGELCHTSWGSEPRQDSHDTQWSWAHRWWQLRVAPVSVISWGRCVPWHPCNTHSLAAPGRRLSELLSVSCCRDKLQQPPSGDLWEHLTPPSLPVRLPQELGKSKTCSQAAASVSRPLSPVPRVPPLSVSGCLLYFPLYFPAHCTSVGNPLCLAENDSEDKSSEGAK